jgi:hypothetical protein
MFINNQKADDFPFAHKAIIGEPSAFCNSTTVESVVLDLVCEASNIFCIVLISEYVVLECNLFLNSSQVL